MPNPRRVLRLRLEWFGRPGRAPLATVVNVAVLGAEIQAAAILAAVGFTAADIG